ncbi:hypothetical protein [Robiginitalea sp. SC105]|uniref:hypothetical protein n=1 Tax=Robiginitalea sp. SC105 TaxID=2762332 RepID=UPI00163AE804|nr:hypothetical protein [Robiginitalea sp. SC105]MBC2837924.1 hypothetical protein [Robiginitalea sp. SC105]
MNLNRSQLALLITGFTLGIVVLTLFNIHLGSGEAEEYVIEMSLDEEDLETLFEEDEPAKQTPQEAIKSHMAFNETAKPSFGNPEPLKTLQEILEERQAQSDSESEAGLGEDSEEFSSSLRELAKKRQESEELLGEKEAEKKEYTNYLKDKRTSISYSLIDRNAYDLPPPIYTCIEGGKVVVNIEVDRSGYVVDASFNASSSSTSNGCLVENAIQYALRARFSSASREEQKGTITYLFVGK